MKKLLFILIIGLTTTAYGQVECSEDRFKGITNCKTEVISVPTQGTDITRANIMAVYNEDQYAIAFAFFSDEWQFLQTDKIYFLIDGQALSYNLHRANTKVQSGFVIEQYLVLLDGNQIETFANAKNIEFKISTSEFVYPKQAQRQLAELVNHK